MKIMNRNGLLLGGALLAMCGLSACSTWDKLDRTEQGAAIGTGGGAVVGGMIGGTKGAVLGGVAGGIAGGVIGHNTDGSKKDGINTNGFSTIGTYTNGPSTD